MGKLFKNSGEVADTAQLARETIQNSWDAAKAHREKHPDVRFKMRFRFVEVDGPDRQELIDALDLDALAERRAAFDKPPVQEGTILDALEDDDRPLRLLFVEDYGTHGLHGHPDLGMKSHLFLALYYIGGSNKTVGAGGSYGFGKSALERASRIHSVVAHSTFEPREDPHDDVTNRLVGFTWWPGHTEGDQSFEGRAQFGVSDGNGAQPVAAGDAIDVADRLGFSRRNHADPDDLGTSFMVIDPAIDPKELMEEVEKWWWPALHEHSFEVDIVDFDGSTLVPRPANNDFVAQFLPAYRIAIGQDLAADSDKARRPSENWRVRGEGSEDLGDLGLIVADRPLREDGSDGEGEALIALMRSPRMVIRYLKVGRNRVSLRGAFVASDASNELLRQTEPALHETWSTNFSADVPRAATQKARRILDRIRSSVRKMAEEVAPPPPKDHRSLTHFSKLMTGFFGDKKGPHPAPPAGGEPISLKLTKRPQPSIEDDSTVTLSAAFDVGVLDSAPDDACRVKVGCKLHIQEDDRAGTRWPVELRFLGDPSNFSQNDEGDWEGDIVKGAAFPFAVVSAPYSNTWTTRLVPTVERTSDWRSA
ncbi:hypothetical protein [Aeromicrobium halocynthiae]